MRGQIYRPVRQSAPMQQSARGAESPPGGDAAAIGAAPAPGRSGDLTMCNLYSITTNQAAISALFRVVQPPRRQSKGARRSGNSLSRL